MRLSLFLFYLLILLIPTQLARHFFFDFSQVLGIRSDYLAPTLYLTDIISIFLIWPTFISSIKKRQRIKLNNLQILLALFFCYLLFNTLFIAGSKGVAFYKLFKVIEFSLLGYAIFKLKPKLKVIALMLSISVFYSSALAIWQFFIQKSTGIFWFLGERTFYAATPGIAAFSNSGSLLLRPYATFPHPNVLGGFLAIVLPFILLFLTSYYSKNRRLLNTWLIISLVVGFAALILSFSRLSWTVAALGFVGVFFLRKKELVQKIKIKKEWLLSLLYLLIILSIIIPLNFSNFTSIKYQYWQERVELIKATIAMISANMAFGVGLNNSTVQLYRYVHDLSGLYIFQPVHNIYLLILSEIGIVGFFFFLLLLLLMVNNLFKSKSLFLYSLAQLFLLGLLDHYLLTLQQGQLLVVLFAALTFAPKMAY